MTIAFRCESCQKEIKAPDGAAGKRGKCPFCGHANYIPVPKTEDDGDLDLAPLDEEEERRRQQEIEALRRRERDLLKEMSSDKPAKGAGHAVESSQDLHHHVVNYCLDAANYKVDRLAVHVSNLKRNKAVGLAAVEDFIKGTAKEPALGKIPPRVLQGFLTQLRDELRAAK